MNTALHRSLRLVAVVGFGVYCAWWAYWLCRGQLPPALFKAATGLPAPTTGCTRSFLCLLRGQVGEAFLWNPFTVPIAVLFLASLGHLAARLLTRKPLRLPIWFLYAWAALLLLAWTAKLLGNPRYW